MYSTIEIKPKGFKDGWNICNYDIPDDREDNQSSLSALGFYHYDRELGAKEAFERLRNYMCNYHLSEINQHKETLRSLAELENPYGT